MANPTVPPAFDGTRAATLADDQPEYLPLPVRIDPQGIVYSAWELTQEERQAIALGAVVIVSSMTFGTPLQPLRVFVPGIRDEVG